VGFIGLGRMGHSMASNIVLKKRRTNYFPIIGIQ